jgi:hypothetical protein
MKTLKFACLTLCMLTAVIQAPGAERFRTDINPALRYYQALLDAPRLSDADHEYLFNREWRGQPPNLKFGELVARYDFMFKLLRQASHAKAPCDWGIDLTEGPDALLPGLAPAKAAAQAARYRAMWHLQNGRQADARDDLLAAFALGRNVARDGILISALVQTAIENILIWVVAENFYQFTPEILKQIADGFDASPPRGTIAQAIAAEKISFHDWLLRKVQEIQQENPKDEAKALQAIHHLITRIGGEGEDAKKSAERADQVLAKAGRTAQGVVQLIQQMEPLYAEITQLMQLPYGQFAPKMAAFNAQIERHSNPFIPMFFSVFQKCRNKEFGVQVNLAMVRAAVEYKLNGEQAYKQAADPCGSGPFKLERFIFEGVDRGFVLKSPFNGRGFDEMLIFVEKEGPPFRVGGVHPGKAVEMTTAK